MRTARLPHVQRKPSAMSRAEVAGPGRPDERGQHHPRDQDRARAPRTRPGRGTATPCRRRRARRRRPGPTSWFIVSPAAISRALPMPRSRLGHDHRQQGAAGGVGEDLGGAQQEHRHEDDGDVTWPVTSVVVRTASTAARSRSTAITSRPAVDAVGQDAGVQAEQQPGQPLQQPGQRDEERVGGLRGDQQRTGGQPDPVAEVARSTTSRPASGTASPCEPAARLRPRGPRGRTLGAPAPWRRHSGASRSAGPLNPVGNGNRRTAPGPPCPVWRRRFHDPVAGVAGTEPFPPLQEPPPGCGHPMPTGRRSCGRCTRRSPADC